MGNPASATPEPKTLIDALSVVVDRQLWRRYCRLAAEIEGVTAAAAAPVYAMGSVEWQRQQEEERAAAEPPFTQELEAAGHRRLASRGKAPAFSGAPSPLGATGGAIYDDFLAQHRGRPELLTDVQAVERRLIESFEAAGRAGRIHARGFGDGGRKEIEPDWFGRLRLDFARNTVVLPDGSEIAGIEVVAATSSTATGRGRGRPAQAMLREALIRLWERGVFTAGTGNERVLALALKELGLSASDPPYGFKSAETVRKLRKALKMSL